LATCAGDTGSASLTRAGSITISWSITGRLSGGAITGHPPTARSLAGAFGPAKDRRESARRAAGLPLENDDGGRKAPIVVISERESPHAYFVAWITCASLARPRLVPEA